eukprot:15211113-Alexandrium_andersonii.AAC.1
MGRGEANALDEVLGSIRRLDIGDRHNPLIREAIRKAAAAAVRELAAGGTRLAQQECARQQEENEVEVGIIDSEKAKQKSEMAKKLEGAEYLIMLNGSQNDSLSGKEVEVAAAGALLVQQEQAPQQGDGPTAMRTR